MITKDQLAATISTAAGITKSQANRALEAVSDAILLHVKSEPKGVRVTGLGTFKLVEHAARTGRNPRTGEAVAVPSRKALQFKALPSVREELRGYR